MDIFTHNPLANMVGPYFLLFYGALLAIFLYLGRRTARALDTSRDLKPLPVPENPNPFEIAFLRGGANEVSRLLVVELFQRGILVETRKRLFQKTKLVLAENINLSELDPALRGLAERFTKPCDPTALDQPTVQRSLGTQLEHWAQWVRDEQLAFEPAQRIAGKRYGLSLVGVFVAVGVYKLAIAISNDHFNVFFLMALGLFGAIGIMAVVRLPRFTSRGKRYLEDLQAAYWNLKKTDLPKPDEFQPAASAAWDPLLAGSCALPVLAMGLFGASALQSSAYATLSNRFANSSCGSSCGAVSACASGCGAGGAGGGCGGGGGGCGGGCGGCGG